VTKSVGRPGATPWLVSSTFVMHAHRPHMPGAHFHDVHTCHTKAHTWKVHAFTHTCVRTHKAKPTTCMHTSPHTIYQVHSFHAGAHKCMCAQKWQVHNFAPACSHMHTHEQITWHVHTHTDSHVHIHCVSHLGHPFSLWLFLI
jgi:hypothetical protein